ncbi:MAG: hypothetical protein AAF191_20180 [Verrucomicrobiota bacterium]
MPVLHLSHPHFNAALQPKEEAAYPVHEKGDLKHLKADVALGASVLLHQPHYHTARLWTLVVLVRVV